MGQERLGPSYFFISLVLGPLNNRLWYVPSSRYTWSSAPILFLQEQIKEIIIRGIWSLRVKEAKGRAGTVRSNRGRVTPFIAVSTCV
jgi:hypothetical protein